MNPGSIPIHLIRALDRRIGFSARRGETAYASAAPRLAGPLHRRILADVQAVLGGRTGVVVDIGAGPGSLTAAIGERLPWADVIGVEPSRRMLELAGAMRAPPNVSFREGSAECLPLATNSVDLVVSALSAHHWSDLAAAISEVRRVLRAGGAARIYDVRFATYTGEELARVRGRLGLDESELRRTIPDGQGAVAPYALIEVAG